MRLKRQNFFVGYGRKQCGKRRKCWLPAFSPFLQCVHGLSFSGSLTLSQTTNFRLFQTERVCRGQFQIWWQWQKVLQKVKKHCGKRRNCSLWAISPFPTVFSIDLYCRHVKTRACLEKGLPITRRQNFRLVQTETNCRRHFKVHAKWKISAI